MVRLTLATLAVTAIAVAANESSPVTFTAMRISRRRRSNMPGPPFCTRV